jgi:uncharacterized membrane protein
MQSINLVVITPAFMGVLFGTGLACVALAVVTLASWENPGAAWVLTGSVLYVVGADVVTIAFNVPLNDALAAVR